MDDHWRAMDDLFLPVVIGVSVLALLAALIALATSSGSYDEIGRGGLSGEEHHPLTDLGLATEVRQVVEARNARRVARGEPPLDVEAEVMKRLRNG